MADKSLKERTVSGLLWGGLSNGLMQILNALFGICLLNLLTPHDYGMVQVLNIFSGVAAALLEGGFISALTNRKEAKHADYNAVFWFNAWCGLALYVLLFFAAPLIADFYGEPRLLWLARFLFLSFFISALGIAQRAYLFSHLMVKQTAVAQVVALLAGGVVGVSMAFMGLAYWALAAQGVVYVSVVVGLSWHYSSWRPSWHWSMAPVRSMFGFSSRLLATSLFTQLNRNVLSALLGKFYSPSVAGLYGNASKWNDMGHSFISGMVNGVAQPVLTQASDHGSSRVPVFRKLLRFTCFVSFPAMFGLGFVAREFIGILVGDAWLASADLLRMLSVYGAFVPINTLYYILVVSCGRSGINLGATVANCVLVWGLMIGLHTYGLHWMVAAFVAVNVLWTLVWQYMAHRLTGLTLLQVLSDIAPFALAAVGSIAVTALLTQAIESVWLLLFSRIFLVALFYVGVLYVAKAQILKESFAYLQQGPLRKIPFFKSKQ